MRGFFGIGVEEISKEQNVGTLVRSAHSFGASYFFAVNPDLNIKALRLTDTSGAFDHMPYYQYDSVSDMSLPEGAHLVGIELTDESIALPSFRHPLRAAYVLGPEMGSLSPEMQDQCEFVIKIPMKFCVNVGVAGAIVMYDRLMTMGRHAPRPVKPGGPTEDIADHVHGARRKIRTGKKD